MKNAMMIQRSQLCEGENEAQPPRCPVLAKVTKRFIDARGTCCARAFFIIEAFACSRCINDQAAGIER
jgi:hypothetical protein